MFSKILVVLGVLLALLFGAAAMQPNDFRIARTTTIAAPADAVFTQVNDFHNWEAWSPWLKLDPSVKTSYEGAPSGVGAVFTWQGNDQVGEGRMTITESRPNELVLVRLEFLKPWQATNTAEFTFRPEGAQTLVSWSMFGHRSFVEKIFCLFMDMDKMVGGDFEKGLASMKAAAERKAG